MIIKLKNKEITIKKNAVPEPLHKVRLQYEYELNTNHLTPILFIRDQQFVGDHIKIDMDPTLSCVISGTDLPITVELVDTKGIVIKAYTGLLTSSRYCLFGERPLRPDFEDYIATLEKRIEELENEGEVI